MGSTRVRLDSGYYWTLVPAEKAMLRFAGASPSWFYGLLYLPCTVLSKSAGVFFGQLSPGHDSIPRAYRIQSVRRTVYEAVCDPNDGTENDSTHDGSCKKEK